MRPLVLVLTLILAAPAAFAAPGDDAITCKPDGNQQEMNACAIDDYQAADKALNQTYQDMIASLPKAKQDALRQEQRGWLRGRDARCKAATKQWQGGSIWPLEYYGCLKDATAQRTKRISGWRGG